MGGERCTGCGLEVEGATDGCRRLFEQVIARDFSDARYFRVHRLTVDTYALQHPDEYCASAKSLLAHLTGLGWLLEHEVSRAVGSEALRQWVEAHGEIAKPSMPTSRGGLTIEDVRHATTPVMYAHAVDRWARATWQAYAPLHETVRAWIREALDAEARPRR